MIIKGKYKIISLQHEGWELVRAHLACRYIVVNTIFAKSRKAININWRIALIPSVNPRPLDNCC